MVWCKKIPKHQATLPLFGFITLKINNMGKHFQKIGVFKNIDNKKTKT